MGGAVKSCNTAHYILTIKVKCSHHLLSMSASFRVATNIREKHSLIFPDIFSEIIIFH